MKTSLNRTLKIIVFGLLTFSILAFLPTDVSADFSVDVSGDVAGGGGGGHAQVIPGKYMLGQCTAVKVNLVKVSGSAPEWVTFYYLFVSDKSRDAFSSSANFIPNGALGQIYSTGYSSTTAFAADVKTVSEIGVENFFTSPSLIMLNFSASKLKSSIKGADTGSATDTFYKVFYQLLTTTKQRNSAYWPDIDMTGISSWSTLKDSIENHPEKWQSLSEYRIIFEPIYRWQAGDGAPTGRYMYATLKAGAYQKNAGNFYGVSNTEYVQNCYTTEAHGPITAANSGDASLTGMQNVNSGRGYAIVRIVNEVQVCDPKTSCCYTSDGTYNATPANPVESSTTYRCTGTVDKDNKCSTEVVSCDTPTPETPSGEPACDPAKGETVYNFHYMFLAGLDKNTTYMHNSAEATTFKDKDILSKLKDKDGNAIVSNTQLKMNIEPGPVYINSTNLSWFYDKLAAAGGQADRFIQEGNDYFISYDTWCSIDDKTNKTTCWDARTGKKISGEGNDKAPYSGFNKDEYIKASVDVGENKEGKYGLTIKEQNASGGLGYTFDIQRYFRQYPDGRPSLQNKAEKATPVTGSGYLHPAMYKISFCIPETPEPPDCDDDVLSASCFPDDSGTKATFHEHDDLKACTIPKNDSGFTAIEKDETIAPNKSEAYCEMACKEDLNIDLPTHKETAAGQYFLLNNYIPKIEATRTCVTTKVDYDEFDNDLKVYENRMPKEYNEYQDYLDIYLHLTGGGAGGSSISDSADGYEYSEKEIACTNPDDATKKDTYIVQQYKIAGTDYNNYTISSTDTTKYAYIEGSTTCKVSSQGQSIQSRNGYPSTKSGSDVIKELAKKAGTTTKNSNSGGTKVGNVIKGKAVCANTVGSATTMVTYNFQYWWIYAYDKAPNRAETGIKFAERSGYWEEPTACSGTGTDYDTALTSAQNEYYNYTAGAWNTYIGDFQNYRDTINTFNRCFNWTDPTDDAGSTGGTPMVKGGEPRIQKGTGLDYDTYYYKFKPEVSFFYPDDYGRGGMDSAVFPVTYTYDYDKDVEGIGHGVGTPYPETTAYYWGKGEEADNTYSGGSSMAKSSPSTKGQNFEPRPILDCNGTTCSSSQTIDFNFYQSSYLKREEKATYEYHLPQVYTKVPSGVVSTDERLERNATWLSLDEEAVPININTPEGDYEYTITIKKIINQDDNDIRFVKKSNNPQDNFEDRFDGSTGNGALNAGSDYICDYYVKNDVYIPDPSKYNFFYRTVDPYNINPLNRTLGYNWSDERGQEVQRVMEETERDHQLLESKDKFEFTLTPTLMIQIREYNKAKATTADGGYADWDMACDDYDTGGYHCYSNFLSCLASGGTTPQPGTNQNCSMFGNALNDYLSTYSDYDLGDLNSNRQALISKQNALDGR